ncbi:GspH/FimT family pseudopilin [Rhodanobacter ginsengiterrae]|uniref:GspH/FimT family pseudopilin n=1 Tax=Rhodanobacter ginsengiterrae TaxID=2008451 RepID=UPI003CF31E40
MQVLSCQRGLSLIQSPTPPQASAHASRRRAFGMLPGRRGDRGFTLVELMVTVTIAVVLLMIAVPSFKNITLSNKLTTTANDLVSAINIARMEAVKRNSSTQLCSDSSGANTSAGGDLGTQCGTETGAVWAMNGGAPSQVLAGTPSLVAPLQLKGNMVALLFTSQGQARKVGQTAPYDGNVVDICTSQMSSDNHRIIKMTAGSILETTKASGACP